MTNASSSVTAHSSTTSGKDDLAEGATLPFMSKNALFHAAGLFDSEDADSPELMKPSAVAKAERLVQMKVAGRAAPKLDMPLIPGWTDEASDADVLGDEATAQSSEVIDLTDLVVCDDSSEFDVAAFVGPVAAGTAPRSGSWRKWLFVAAAAVVLQAGLVATGNVVRTAAAAAVGNTEQVAKTSASDSDTSMREATAKDIAKEKKVVVKEKKVVEPAPEVSAKPAAASSSVAPAPKPVRIKAQWPKSGQPRPVMRRRSLPLYPLDI